MPHLGGMAREDVTPDDVRRMLAALKKSGLSDGTVSRTLDVARQLLPKAATDGVRYRIKERRRMQIATRQQAAAIESATDARYRLLVRTAFTTAARWGELIAIRGTDVEQRGPGYIVRDPADDRGNRNDVHGARLRQDSGSRPGHLGSRGHRPGAGSVRERALLHRAARRLPQAVDVPQGLLAARDREGRHHRHEGPRHAAQCD